MSKNYIKLRQSELVIGLVGAIGTDYDHVASILTNQLKRFNYVSHEIKISKDIIPTIFEVEGSSITTDVYKRKNLLMDFGNRARKESQDNSILALGVSDYIRNFRIENSESEPLDNNAFIVNSIKHPDEIHRLRQIYGNGFYLIGIHSNELSRIKSLTQVGLNEQQINELTSRDSNEGEKFGQKTQKSFQLSDFFIYIDNKNRYKSEISRILDLIFSKPHLTPTFDEYAMFMAFAASLRSADLSRQVGSVIANSHREIISTGANDCPKFGGGLYWPDYNPQKQDIVDIEDGRDYKLGYDSNKKMINSIFEEVIKSIPDDIQNREEIIQKIKSSKISDITEFGRPVHAEMEAILMSARNNHNLRGCIIFCTTFPCHNCAKHIIASGISKVIYIEPYPKSLALKLHKDSISTEQKDEEDKVIFEPFSGVGPRRFFDLFSMSLGSGVPIERKGKDGKIIQWDSKDIKKAFVRTPLNPASYIEREEEASNALNSFLEKTKSEE